MGFDHFYEIYSSDHSVAKIWSAECTWNLRNSSFKNSAKVYGWGGGGETCLSQQNASLCQPPLACDACTIGNITYITLHIPVKGGAVVVGRGLGGRSPEVGEFKICYPFCSFQLNKGSEITLKVNAATSVYDVRKMLVKRTSIVFEDVQLRFRVSMSEQGSGEEGKGKERGVGTVKNIL